jgi:AI2M/AI1M-like, HNH endonuclease/Type II intron maturase
LQSQTKFYNRQRSINGKVGFYIPKDVLLKKRKRYMRDGKVIHRTELINDSEYDIMTRYQGEYRGLVNYYGLAHNLASLGYVKRTMEISLLKTLAKKGKSTVAKTAKRLQAITQTPNGPRTCLKVVIPRAGKAPLVALFGGISLRRQKPTAIQDQVITAYPRMRSELIARLLHDTCEICGAKEEVQMHHIRRLANLNKKGRREKPLWMQIMIARKRKTIPVCRACHMDIHHNTPKSTRQGNWRAG